jgi:hypothetical protein
MNTTLREALARRANDAGLPDLDIEALVGLGEHRLRRRRRAAVLGSAAAVVVVIALAVGASLHGPVKRSQGPVNHPRPSPTEKHELARRILYSDTQLFSHTTGTIHFGDRVVDTRDGFVHMDVTDDGFVYTAREGAWFTDGGTPEQVGSHLCGTAPDGEFGNFANRAVMSANTGSLAAWFECTRGAPATLVVYDTASRRTLARRQMAVCSKGPSLANSCELFGLTSGQVYFNQGVYAGSPRPEYRFDVTTGRLSATTRKAYAADIRSQPRGLVVGDTWQTGTATDGIGIDFRAIGSRLAPWWRLPNGEQVLTDSFDTATGQAVRLHLPSGYRAPHGAVFKLFEWLDADTVALSGAGRGHSTDILTCHLSDGRCALAVKGHHKHDRRILPHLPLPG